MTTVTIIYQSGSGQTRLQANAVAKGAASVAETQVVLLTLDEARQNWDLLNASDAMIFGSSGNMGSASAQFKAFMNATVSIWYRQLWKDKLAAGFTNSGDLSGDNVSTLMQLFLFAAQHGMHWIGLDLLPNNDTSKDSIEDIYRTGSWIGAIAQSNKNQESELVPPRIDLLTAEHLGRRIALATQRWARGNSVSANYSLNRV